MPPGSRRCAPGARLVLLEGGSHFPPMDAPEQLAEALRGFLTG